MYLATNAHVAFCEHCSQAAKNRILTLVGNIMMDEN
jgi:hypothetical protein